MANEFELSFQGSATLYVILRRQEDAAVYDHTAFVTWSDSDLGDYALSLTFRGGDVYQGHFPADVAQGSYRVLYYLQAGAAPDVDDLLLATRLLYWTGQNTTSEPDDGNSEIGVSESALTSVANVAGYLRLDPLTRDNQALIASLVNQISARIERICGRRFHAQDWTERAARPANGLLTLRHFPVLVVDSIATGCMAVVRVRYNDSALLARVCVQYDDTGRTGLVVLKTVGNDGSETITNLSLADHATTSDLAIAINNVTGWHAQKLADAPSDQLLAMSTKDVLGHDVALNHADQTLDHWEINHASGTVRLAWPASRVVVRYHAGHETLPEDLTLIATELVAQAFAQSRISPSMKSESLGDYSYTLATQSQITRDLWSRLRLYMEVR